MAQVTSSTIQDRSRGLGFRSLLLLGVLTLGASFCFAAGKKETIRATAMGTGTQLGQNANVRLIIFDLSTDEDRQTLLKAFQQGQTEGLTDALNKMKAVGHVDMEGTRGYDVSFIRSIETPTGRQIRFITNRMLRNAEMTSSLTRTYSLTAGEINVAKDKNKSTGFIYPAAQLVINKEGEFEFRLNQNAWNLINIMDYK
jgi:hypothetical protein